MKMTFKITEQFRAMVRAGSKRMTGVYDTSPPDGAVANLFLVKDQGVYLMPGSENETNQEHVIYARGMNPVKNKGWYDKARNGLGGDDFAENIPMGQTWVDAILGGGATKLVISITARSMKTELFK